MNLWLNQYTKLSILSKIEYYSLVVKMNRPWLVESAKLVALGDNEHVDRLFNSSVQSVSYVNALSTNTYVLVGESKNEKLLHRGEKTWVQLTGTCDTFYVLGWVSISHNEHFTGIDYVQSFYPERGWNIAEFIISLLRNKFNKPAYPTMLDNVSFWSHNSHLLSVNDQLRTVYIGDFARATIQQAFTSAEDLYKKYETACGGLAMDRKNFCKKYRAELYAMLTEATVQESVQIMSTLNGGI